MATLWITEFNKQPVDFRGNVTPVANFPPIAQQTVTITGTSAQSAVLNDATCYVRVYADANCAIELAVNPTATAAKMPLAADSAEYIGVNAQSGLKIAGITR